MTPSPGNKITLTALLAALALIFSYIEAIIPFSIGIPGVKLGIANIVIIIVLYCMGPRLALTVNVIRIIIAGLLFTGLFGACYALSGALLSLAVMYLLKKTGVFSVTGVSIAGGVTHNFGQILVAAAIVETPAIFSYFPVLIFSGIASGAIIGITATLIMNRLPRSMKPNLS